MQPQTDKAVEFLEKWEPGGPWVLTAIQTDRKRIDTTTLKNTDDLRRWIDQYNGHRNIYFHVNEVNGDLDRKALKENIRRAKWLHVDIDPAENSDLEAERERALAKLTDRLPKGIPEPTVIIFSGGGYQGFWLLDEPVEIDGDVTKAEKFELYNKRLEQVFGGDHCHNVDRIMRLPGTINIPDAKKEKKGRGRELAKCLKFDRHKSSDISQFKPAQEVQLQGGVDNRSGDYGADVEISGNIDRIENLSELDEWNVPDRVKIIVAQGHHPDQPKKGDNSRSAWLFDAVCGLTRCGVPDDKIFGILTDPEWGISESVLDAKSSADKYAIRQIKRAKEYNEDPHLTMMNDRHAIIGNVGGKCRVIEEIEDDVLHRSRITMSSFEDIRNRYSNVKVQVGTTAKGDPQYMPLGKYWLESPLRRQYDTMKFMPQGDKPGVYNLWRGFNVEPRPGSCDLFLDHIHKNVCNGHDDQYQYLLNWMARAIQYPASPGEVAIVLRGDKGVGKSIVPNILGRLFGRHYLHIANPSHLVGNFNAHLRDVILLFADEAFYAGDKKHESVLKMLVTEDSIPIEQKGVDVETYPNYVHLMMAANDPHVIRASGDERRYFVVNVGNQQKQNKQFFSDMMRQMENGGYEALLFYLQNMDLTDFQVREVPETDALQEQKVLSLSVEEEWWYRKLEMGRLTEDQNEWDPEVPCNTMINDFTEYAEKWRFTRRGNETSLGRFLGRVCPHLDRYQKSVTADEIDSDGRQNRRRRRLYFYNFGSLEACRAAWEDIYGKTEWPLPVRDEGDMIEDPF